LRQGGPGATSGTSDVRAEGPRFGFPIARCEVLRGDRPCRS